MPLRFVDLSGRKPVHGELHDHVGHGTKQLRIAISYFGQAGLEVLRPHGALLCQTGSFIVVNLEEPTDCSALCGLHTLAAGHVYVHLGFDTPKERSGRSGIMHSKAILAEGQHTSRLWVGSHNFTASAIAGANFEAAITYEGASNEKIFADAAMHLEACKKDSQLFNPAVHCPARPDEPGFSEDEVLVIVAEADPFPDKTPYTVQLRLLHQQLDAQLRLERQVHLYLLPAGYFSTDDSFDPRDARLWEGKLTGGNQTDRNSLNPGIMANLESAGFQINAAEKGVPRFGVDLPDDPSTRTQGVLRLERELQPGLDLYSVLDSRIGSASKDVVGKPVVLHHLPSNMQRFFNEKSVVGGNLISRKIIGRRRVARLGTYETEVSGDLRAQWESSLGVEIIVQSKKPAHPLSRFAYLAKRHIDLRRLK